MAACVAVCLIWLILFICLQDDGSSVPMSGAEEGEHATAAAVKYADEGVTDTDFNRAQRFKRLYRLLASSVVSGWLPLAVSTCVQCLWGTRCCFACGCASQSDHRIDTASRAVQ